MVRYVNESDMSKYSYLFHLWLKYMGKKTIFDNMTGNYVFIQIV